MSKNGQNTSRRFTSEKNAKQFASNVGGTLKDLRGHSERKSDFKVEYVRDSKRSFNYNGYDPSDFDSDINGNGTHWHTADDL